MATYRAIAAVSQAVLGLLEEGVPRDEFPDAGFELFQTADFQSRPLAEGVSLYLYRVEVSPARRRLPPHVGEDGVRYRPPLPVDLHFLLTTWGRTAAKQQRLLGWCMRTLEDTPGLGAGLLRAALPDAASFRAEESVELLYEPVTLQDMANIFEGTRPVLSVGYVARMVALESTIPLVEAGPVQTREFAVGTLPRE